MHHNPTDETRANVKAWAARGVPQTYMAKQLRISPTTLRNYYRDELDDGLEEVNCEMAGKLYDLAMSGNVTAIIFWLKTRARWRSASKDDAGMDESGLIDPDPDV